MIPGKYLVQKLCSEVYSWYETAEVCAMSEEDAIRIARNGERDEEFSRPDWSKRFGEDWDGYDETYEIEEIIYEPEEEEEEESAELVKPAGVLTVFLEGVEL